MAIIIFIRHGRALTNERGIMNSDIEGFPLVQTGILETQKVAKELDKVHVSALYCSPVLRARQTADIIGEAVNLNPRIDDRLREREAGEMRNMPAADGDWLLDVDWKTSKVETMASMLERARSFINSVAAVNGIYVAVTHDSIIKSVFMNIYNMDDTMENALKNRNSSMSIIATKKGWTPLAMNYVRITDPLLAKMSEMM